MGASGTGESRALREWCGCGSCDGLTEITAFAPRKYTRVRLRTNRRRPLVFTAMYVVADVNYINVGGLVVLVGSDQG